MIEWSVFASFLFFAFSAASLTNFFDDCISEGMILDFWGKIVQKEIRENQINEKKRGYKVKKIPFWKKPLGACIICTNIWITIILFLTYCICIKLFIVLAILGMSNTALKFIIK